jgi:16S rRNA G527 N7-methylase RsmG
MSISASFAEILRAELSGIIEISDAQTERLFAHYELLRRWNRRLNLTTVIDMPVAVYRHYCESLFVAAHISGRTVVDIGSGAGFPGIPLAIVRPEWTVTLVESHQRKAVFLREATRDLPNVDVIAGRAESLSSKYDWQISRAVDPGVVSKLCCAPRFAILMSSADLNAAQCSKIVPLPWGSRRILAIGPTRRADGCFTWNAF